ncbi:hypothetical protein CHS0354_013621 [Potamilus streckersoni]|uniref:Uncharacterized protein n=1 Tax=Potamilus streckersoni TaxID=2493646 RepID=A0AAE0SKT2_9BIVA|nr:hypothetical protein CHS0354_013621 [Potamilus streckersoni]
MASVSSGVQQLHNSLLMDLSDMMDPSDSTYKNFIRCLVCDTLPLGRLSRVKQDPIDVFNLMEERGVLGIGKYQHLEKALETSQYIIILDYLKKAKECITEQMRKSSDDPKMDKSYNIEPETVSSIKPEDISKLRDDLIKVYKRLRCVQVSPIYEMTRCPDIDNVYVDLVIEMKQDSKIKVTSYKQLFLDERGSKLKRVYLCGKGGLGKTTFCRKVLHAWCNAHEGRAVAQGDYFQDETVLKMFDLLFYINLREVSVDKNLIETLCDKLHFLVPMKSILEMQLRLNGDKVLFILDGLDEMIVKAGFIENIVIHRDYPDCCFLVSSRPWKISQMELKVETEIDLLLDLQGFSKRNAIRFAENIFKNCYKDGNVIQQFEKEIDNNEVAKELIHVPLLLVFMAHCWYEKRTIPSKLHELYISFLNMMADRMKEKYKKDPNCNQMNFTLGDTQSPFPSKLSKISLVVNFGEGLLLSLCGAAHHFLLSDEKENSLVFEETKLLNALGDRGEEILDVSLKLGLLSVTDSVSFLNRKLSVSFLHKTMQEFFTAACFILNPEKLTNFISSIGDFNDVQQNENIIVFLVGLMPELGNRVLEKVNEFYRDRWDRLRNDEELEIERLRSGEELLMESEEEVEISFLWLINRTRLFDINSFYLRCKEEVIGENVLLNLSCLCLEGINLDLHCWNLAFLQILDLMRIQFPDDRADLRGLTGLTYLALRYLSCELYLPESCCLSVLIIESVTLSSNGSDVLGKTLIHCTKLKRFRIRTTNLLNCVLDVSHMIELTHLYMSEVKLSSSCCDVLGRTLTHCTKLERFIIHCTDLHNCLLDLSKMTELTVLIMSRVMLSSSCCDVLGSTLTNCTKLKILSIHKVDLHNCLLKISKMTELTNLDLSEVTLSNNCDKFGTTLLHSPKLERLRIRKTNFHNFLLDISIMTELKDLDMSDVTLSSSCCDAFTLTHCTKLEKLTTYNIDLHNCLLDLSNMTELKYLDMLGVTMSSSCCDVLGSTLTHCTKLAKFKIHNTNLHNCLLDLSNMTELTELDMLRVTLSSACCDVLGSSLTHCTRLELLSITNMDLHNCLLDLSNMRELTVLNMSGITLSNSSCQIFCHTLAQCTKLKKFKISSKDILNCGTQLDLSKMTELGKFHP